VSDLWSRANRILELLSPNGVDSDLVVRHGSAHDGGYIILDDLSNSDFLISMGIGNDVNFELSVASKLSGMHLYDDSILHLPEPISESVFYRERIGNNEQTTILQAIDRAPADKDLLLKIDIEGSEWEAFSRAEIAALERFRQIVVEFHHFEDIEDMDFYQNAIQVLEKLDQTHFVLNSHPNNWGEVLLIDNLVLPQVIEVTYLRKGDYEPLRMRREPIRNVENLNTPCNPSKPELYLLGSSVRSRGSFNTSREKILSWMAFDELTQQRDELTQQRDELTQQRDELTQQRDELTQQRDELTQQRDVLLNSTIWKLTKPLRILIETFRK
jgi:hypothetical protein